MLRRRHGPTNGTDVSPSAVLCTLAVTVCLLVSTSEGLPTKVQHHRSDDSESLSSILRDLEDVVFRLKEIALKIDYENRKSSVSDSDFDDPSAELNEKSDRYLLEDTYPELVAGSLDKKSSRDSSIASSANNLTSAEQQLLRPAADFKESANAAAGVKPQGTTGQVFAGKTSNGEEQADDISLREALEYLVSLAKQKKQERRDHDIPFPLTDK